MKPRKRERALRVLLAALLNSELSIPEIEDLLGDISRSPKLPSTVARLINSTIDCIQRSTPQKQISQGPERASIVDSLWAAIQRKRMSKAEVLDIIKSISPAGLELAAELPKSTSIREILVDFLSTASTAQIEHLVRMVDPAAADDAYLHGITRRN